MSRTYDAQSLVELPRFDAASMAAVCSGMLSAAAAEKKLAANVAAGVAKLTKSTAELKVELSAGVVAPQESGLRAAMLAEVKAWSGVENWLRGTVDVGEEAQAATAQKLLDVLFSDGLKFLRTAAAKRWSDTQARLDRLESTGLTAAFGQLGGAGYLETLKQKHEAVGIAAGFTSPKAAAELPAVRTKSDATKAALRNLVLQIVANASHEESDAATALAEKLLAPLVAYVPPAVKAPTPAAAPAAPGPA